MTTELFAENQATTAVTSGGTDAPASGTQETWTVASSTGFPVASNTASPPTQFHVADVASGFTSEIIAVTNVSGTTWTVTRGAESTTPVAHTAGFTIVQVVTTGFLGLLTPPPVDWFNVVDYGATLDGNTVTDGAITATSATLTSATANFTSADVGKLIQVRGAGTGSPSRT